MAERTGEGPQLRNVERHSLVGAEHVTLRTRLRDLARRMRGPRLEALESLAEESGLQAVERIRLVQDDDEDLAHVAFGAVNLSHAVPGVFGAREDETPVAKDLCRRRDIEVFEARRPVVPEEILVIQHERLPAPGRIPVLLGVQVEEVRPVVMWGSSNR